MKGNWKRLQEFLAQVYATLAAAQWESGKIGLEVEVLFDGMRGTKRRLRACDAVLVLDGTCVSPQNCCILWLEMNPLLHFQPYGREAILIPEQTSRP